VIVSSLDHNQTNVEGVFSAGDVTNVPEKQIIIACGEGSKACLSAFKYLYQHKF
jgi:alkyl hydroperoxide reductase subunit F